MVRVAVAHDYLTQRGGGERVALAIGRTFESSPFYTAVFDAEATYSGFSSLDIRTSALQRVPAFRRDPRRALPLLARAWDSFPAVDADALVVSSSGWAHGLRAAKGTAKLVYCHNPARWLYQQDEYVTRAIEARALKAVRFHLTRWDQRAARTADLYVANSTVVQRRIHDTYGIDARVLYPPVSIDPTGDADPVPGERPGFWLTVSRGRGYKNTQAVIDGVLRTKQGRLLVTGERPPSVPVHERVRWLGIVTEAQLRWLYANARALVSVSNEDFGLTPIEANAFGTPVAVLQAGGFLDSTAPGRSGAWIAAASAEAVQAALESFPHFDAEVVRRHAANFSESRFLAALRNLTSEAVDLHRPKAYE
ncbi:glycosyltransferase [Modestobacter sp. SYSU DS0875]